MVIMLLLSIMTYHEGISEPRRTPTYDEIMGAYIIDEATLDYTQLMLDLGEQVARGELPADLANRFLAAFLGMCPPETQAIILSAEIEAARRAEEISADTATKV
jgi:hypothetical protein